MWHMAERFRLTSSYPDVHEHNLIVRLVRIPKSGSSAFSVVVRRLAGCKPSGPCCKFPGDPVGSCPLKGLECRQVIGCIGHAGIDLGQEGTSSFKMILVRNPMERALSAFFYPGHQPKCDYRSRQGMHRCFLDFLTSSFSTPLLNQLNGRECYQGRWTNGTGKALATLNAMDFVGITEVFTLSVVTLFAKHEPLQPLLREDLQPSTGSRLRTSGTTIYRSHLKSKFFKVINETLRQEMKVYNEALVIFCRQLRATGLWADAATQRAVKARSAELYAACS